MTWGLNDSPWNQQLGVIALREGCSGTPAACVASLDSIASAQGVAKIYVSMPYDLATSVANAKLYSQLSLTHKAIVEVGFDNFVNQTENLQLAGQLPDPASFLTQMIAAVKSANPNLGFGITLFEDSLSHAVLQNAVLPAALRAKVDYIHLYVRYRQDAASYVTYVSQTKALFPNAKIIAGAYSYDRIDYLPCQYKGTAPCTVAQESALFKQLLETQATLVRQGTIYGLEFSFGYFGHPEDWAGWKGQSQVCNPARILECYANTKSLQTVAQQVLNASFGAVVSLPHTSLYMGTEYVNKTSTPGKLVMTNSGTGALTISSIGVGGANSTNFPLTHNCPQILNAGANCTLTIYFKPTATGTRSGQVIISDNAGTGTQTVNLTGLGISSTATYLLSAAATQLSFGNVPLLTSKVLTVAITNTGSSNVTISGAAVSGLGLTISGITPNTVLTPGQSASLRAVFAPSLLGLLAGKIVVTSNATNSPITISASGSGVAAGGTAHAVALAWTRSTSTVSGYNVYRSLTKGGSYTLLTATKLTAPSYSDTSVTSGHTYYYVATSVDSAGKESIYSNEATAVVP